MMHESAFPWWSRILLGAGGALLVASSLPAHQQGAALETTDTVVNYLDSKGLADPVTQFQQKLSEGKATLEYEPEHGYLISVLKALNIPITSQTLVFSKTSSQSDHTSPSSPRAMYYNGSVYIGWAKDDPLLDVIAMDPKKGPIFFTLEQRKDAKPVFVRKEDCMTCHMTSKTLNVPGLVVRSVLAEPDGTAVSQANTFVSGHNNPLKERWGGWYVTGNHGQDLHMGNAFLAGKDLSTVDLKATSDLADLKAKFDTSKFLSPYSDTVALLVLDHNVRMQNMITRAQYETLYAQHDRSAGRLTPAQAQDKIKMAAEPLLRYMLFQDEAPLHGPIQGLPEFVQGFGGEGPRDSKGRSLREFDLKDHLFKYRCSYLIYSEQFDALPDEMKQYLWTRLDEILAGKDKSPFYKGFTEEERNNVRQILVDTKPEFKAWCEAHKS